MRRRCIKQTSIFSFDNLTIYNLLESMLNDREQKNYGFEDADLTYWIWVYMHI